MDTNGPTQVDKQFGWVVRNPRFRSNLNIQPIKKINGISPQPQNIDWKPFYLIWACFEWLEHEILRISDFWKNVRVPFFKNPQKKCFENAPRCPAPMFQKPSKHVFEKQKQIWEQLVKTKSPLSVNHKIMWHKWEPRSRKVNNDEPDLSFFTETFALL